MRQYMKKNILAGLVLMFAFIIVLSSSVVLAQQPIVTSVELTLTDAETIDEISWRPDGLLLAWAVENDIRIYTADLQEFARLEGHKDEIISLDWSPDGTKIVSGSLDKTIRIWSMNEGSNFGTSEILPKQHSHFVLAVAWSPDGSKLASVAVDEEYRGETAYYTTSIWDVDNQQVIRALPSAMGSTAIAWHPNSVFLASGGYKIDENAIRIWNIVTGDIVKGYPSGGDGYVTRIDWDSTGRLLAVARDGYVDSLNIAETDVDSIYYRMYLGLDGGTSSVNWRNDDKYIAAGGILGDIAIWHALTGREVAHIPLAHSGGIREVEWSPDGTKLASVSAIDKTLKVWDTSNLPKLDDTPTATAEWPTPTFIP